MEPFLTKSVKLFDLSFSILSVCVCVCVCLREKREREKREGEEESVCVCVCVSMCLCLCLCLCLTQYTPNRLYHNTCNTHTRNTQNTYTTHKHTCVVQESHQDGPEIVVQYKFVKFSSDTYKRKRTRAHTTRKHAIAHTHARMRRAR